MKLYRPIFSQAIKTAWHNKYLWFFGLFAALLGGSGELEIIFRGISGDQQAGFFPSLRGLSETGIFSANIFANINHLLKTDPFTFFIAVGIFLLVASLSVFILWLSIVSQAAVVSNAALIKNGKKHEFKAGLEKGISKFWPVLGLNLLVRFAVYVIFILLGIPILASVGNYSAISTSVLFIISFIIFIPLGFIFSFVIKYAIAFNVIKNSKFVDSIKQGWDLFAKNWLVSLEMAFILFFINFLVGLGLILTILILAVPFLFIALVLSQIAFFVNFYIIMILTLILFICLIAVVGAMLSVFQISSWTGLFIELVSKGGVSKLTRVAGKE